MQYANLQVHDYKQNVWWYQLKSIGILWGKNYISSDIPEIFGFRYFSKNAPKIEKVN